MEQLYKMILVDDEDEVRGRISSRISEETGFSVVGTAGNGYDALDLIEKHSPHVVLTDIKMPYIDGIELASIIRRDYPTVRIGFLTGYNEFDYAREAIKLRVQSYLTKPLTEEAIREFLEELRRELDEEFRTNYSRQMVEQQYQESLPLLIDHCFTSLLFTREESGAAEVEQLKGHGVDLDQEYRTAFVSVERNKEHWNVIEFEKLKMSVRSNIEKALDREGISFHTFFFNDGIVAVLKGEGHRFEEEVDLVLNRIIRSIERFLSLRIMIGVSRRHSGFRDFGPSCDEATRAVASGRLLSVGRLVYVDDLSESRRRYALLEPAEIEKLDRTLRYGTPKEMRDLLGVIRRRVTDASELLTDHRLVMVGIVHVLLQYSLVVDTDITALAGGDLLETVSRIKSIDEFIGWAALLAEQLQEQGRRSRMDNAERLLSDAIGYMEENYQDKELTMQKVCAAQGISASYLGQLFKKYKKSTFVTYLTAIRMEHAKDALRLSGSRIIEVAEACGYRDVYYFSHCFRKYVGSPPKKYREQHA